MSYTTRVWPDDGQTIVSHVALLAVCGRFSSGFSLLGYLDDGYTAFILFLERPRRLGNKTPNPFQSYVPLRLHPNYQAKGTQTWLSPEMGDGTQIWLINKFIILKTQEELFPIFGNHGIRSLRHKYTEMRQNDKISPVSPKWKVYCFLWW